MILKEFLKSFQCVQKAMDFSTKILNTSECERNAKSFEQTALSTYVIRSHSPANASLFFFFLSSSFYWHLFSLTFTRHLTTFITCISSFLSSTKTFAVIAVPILFNLDISSLCDMKSWRERERVYKIHQVLIEFLTTIPSTCILNRRKKKKTVLETLPLVIAAV